MAVVRIDEAELNELLAHNKQMKAALSIHQNRDARIWSAICATRNPITKMRLKLAYRTSAPASEGAE